MKAKLKLVHSAEPKTERLFVAQIHRSSQHLEDRSRNLTRRYSSLDNAVVGCTRFMIANGYVGDVCELSHKATGMQLGTVRLTANGKLVTQWVWE